MIKLFISYKACKCTKKNNTKHNIRKKRLPFIKKEAFLNAYNINTTTNFVLVAQ